MSLSIRNARPEDLADIVALLADDPLGAGREDPNDLAAYRAAFDAIERDPNQIVGVAVDAEAVVGVLQVSFLPGLARKGAWRGQIEGVRIAATRRGDGLGGVMFEWAIAQCRDRGCHLVQLTSDKSRSDAHRFYDGLGFVASHEGYKLAL